MGWVESQPRRLLLPQVDQEGGVDHGDGEAAHPLPVLGGEVVGRPAVEPLRHTGVMAPWWGALPPWRGSPSLGFLGSYLGRDAAPKVGVEGLRVQHGGHH